MLRNNFIIAIRSLLRHKTFSLINILGLSVGMTAFFLMFMYVRMETSYDNFHSRKERIYRVVSDVKTPSETLKIGLTTAPIALNMKKDFPEVEESIRFATDDYLVRKGDVMIQEKNVVLADSTMFKVFDFPLLYGDKATALTQPMSVILSRSTAKKYFQEANPVGQHLLLSGQAINATITGLMEDIPENSQVKANMIVSMSSFKPLYGVATSDSEWTNHGYYTYLLLKPNTNVSSLQAKFPAFMELHHGEEAKRLQMQDALSLEPLLNVYLRSKRDGFVTGNINNVYIFSVIAIFILLIACINFINLTTARSVERAKEVGVRKVVGAIRFQLARQFIGESIIICLMAFVVSILLSSLITPLFNELAGKQVAESLLVNPGYILMLLVLSIIIGAMAGLYPSLVLSSFKPVSVLKGNFSTGSKGIFLRKGLVVFQFTISIVLIVSTLIVYRQLGYMRSQDLGFSKEQTIIIQTNYDKNKDAFKRALASIPGVISSTYSSGVPGGHHESAYSQLQNKSGEMQKSNLDLYFVDFNYIDQYKLKFAAGRGFSPEYGTDSTQAMVINETAAKFFGYATPQEAIGRNFNQWGRKGKIIGVLRDYHYASLQQSIKPLTMRIERGQFDVISVKLASENITATLNQIGSKWSQIIPNRPFEYNFLDDFFDRQYRSESRFGNLFFNFTLLAIFISCLGLLGLASYSTIQRTKEIGVRKVLGASVSNVVRLLSKDFIKLVLVAFVIASPIGWFGMHVWLKDFAYQVPISLWNFVIAGSASIAIAFITISFQAIRAALSNPIKSLRTE